MGDKIFIVDGKDLHPVEESKYENEAKLQEYLEFHPELLAPYQISSENPPKFILIRREMPISDSEDSSGRWSCDHLFVDDSGILTFVEVKRSTDVRIRREVIGQLLEYAANADRYVSVAQIIEHGSEYWLKRSNKVFEDVIKERLFDNQDIVMDDFWGKVKYNAKEGIVRLIFAADKLPSETKRIIEYLNKQSDKMEVLGLEIKYFTGEHGRNVLVPRICGQSEEAKGQKSGGLQRTSKQWDETSFFEDCRNRIEAEVVDKVIWPLYKFIKDQSDLPYWGSGKETGSFSFKINYDNKLINVFNIASSKYITINFGWISNQEIEAMVRERVNDEIGVKLAERPYPSIDASVLLKINNGVELFKNIILDIINKMKSVN